MKQELDNIRIVLIQTSHPGNIGSAARAMKVMGLSDLCLVAPKRFPDAQATAMASGADDILQQAKIVENLPEAIADCQLVIGTSARSSRYLQWPLRSARACGEYVAENCQQKIAIIFGRERTGLTNDELGYCHSLVHIPTNPDYSSLNVASAVQLIAYECSIHINATAKAVPQTNKNKSDALIDAEAMERFYQHLETVLTEIRYLDPKNPKHLMRRLRRLFSRLDIVQSEMNILRGILSAMQGRKFQKRRK